MSPFGCMTPNPMRSSVNSGRVMQPSSMSMVAYVSRIARNARSSVDAKCLRKSQRQSSTFNEMAVDVESTYLPSHIEVPPPKGIE